MSWLDRIRQGLLGDRVLIEWHGPGDPPKGLTDSPLVIVVDARSGVGFGSEDQEESGERSRSEQDRRLNDEFDEWMRKEGEDDDD